MKIESITFVKSSDIPATVRRGETRLLTEQIVEHLKKTPKGQAVSMKITGAKKYTRYALQKTLQKLGQKDVRVSECDGKFYVSVE